MLTEQLGEDGADSAAMAMAGAEAARQLEALTIEVSTLTLALLTMALLTMAILTTALVRVRSTHHTATQYGHAYPGYAYYDSTSFHARTLATAHPYGCSIHGRRRRSTRKS